MSSPHRASSTSSDHSDNARKRVCKACDRCRLKKSKCDGASPCSRCKADNAICVFGERKKSHDKVYPKGYVEMLEQQQSQLVAGLRELYRRLQDGENWPGKPLKNSNGGHPLTHDILERLDLLHSTSDTPIKHEGFEDDLSVLQQRCLVENGSPQMRRRKSISEESEPGLTSADSMASPTRSVGFADPFSQKQLPPTPPMQDSPYLRASQISVQTKSQPSAVPMYPQNRGFNPVAVEVLQRQMWQSQQLPMDQSMDIDMFSPYSTTMAFDNSIFNQYAPQGPDPMSMNWADLNDFINPNAVLQA